MDFGDSNLQAGLGWTSLEPTLFTQIHHRIILEDQPVNHLIGVNFVGPKMTGRFLDFVVGKLLDDTNIHRNPMKKLGLVN